MAQLTVVEARWINRLQKVLNECPSERIGFYTVGDPCVMVYDLSKESEIEALMRDRPNCDFCTAVAELDAGLTEIGFPAAVHSTSG